MINWRLLSVGEKIMWNVNDFDGKQQAECIVNIVECDHVILNGDGMQLWLDDCNAEEFFPVSGKYKICGVHYTYDSEDHDVHFHCCRTQNIKWVSNIDCEEYCPYCDTCTYYSDAKYALDKIECDEA